MDAEILKDELDQAKAELLKSQAQVKGLRGVLGEVLNGYLESTPHDVGFNWVDWSPKAQQALSSSTGNLQAELDAVNKQLKVLKRVERSRYRCGRGLLCPLCHKELDNHNDTCELSALITELESKRDALMKALEGIG